MHIVLRVDAIQDFTEQTQSNEICCHPGRIAFIAAMPYSKDEKLEREIRKF